MGVVNFGNAGDRLTVRNLRSADIRLDELATHTVDDDVEEKFAHASDDRLAALSSILTRKDGSSAETVEREAHLLWSPLVFGSIAI